MNQLDLSKEQINFVIEPLIGMARAFNVEHLVIPVLTDEKFLVWSGSASPNHHHYGKHGLLRHTGEVIGLAVLNVENLELQDKVSLEQLLLACLYHDIGKIHDYKPVDETMKEWEYTDHASKIHHISRSGIMWMEVANKHNYKYKDEVLHCILAHHGQKEWGSPVKPRTREAWMLHLCDGISARMDDADTLIR